MLTVMDWVLCGIQYEGHAYWYNLFSVLCYGAVNFFVTVSTGTPVYEGLITWEDWRSLAIGAGLVVLFTVVFFVEYWLTRVKIRALGLYGYGKTSASEDPEEQETEIVVVLV